MKPKATQNPEPGTQNPAPIRRYMITVRAIVEVSVMCIARNAPPLKEGDVAPINSDDIIDTIMTGCWDTGGPAEGGENYIVSAVEDVRCCRVCGCTEHEPCLTSEGACSWVEEDLCSACFDGWVEKEYFTAEGEQVKGKR